MLTFSQSADDGSDGDDNDAESSKGLGSGDDSNGAVTKNDSGDSNADSEAGSNSGGSGIDPRLGTEDAEEDDGGVSGFHQPNSIGASVVAILGAVALL